MTTCDDCRKGIHPHYGEVCNAPFTESRPTIDGRPTGVLELVDECDCVLLHPSIIHAGKIIEAELRRRIPDARVVNAPIIQYNAKGGLTFDAQIQFADGSWMTAENIKLTRLDR